LQDDVSTSRDLGPARIRFQRGKPKLTKAEKPTLYLYVLPNRREIFAATAHPRNGWKELGTMKSGTARKLGWMDFEFKLEEMHWSAAPEVAYQKLDSSAKADGIPEAMEIRLGNENVWVELGAAAQVSVNDSLYYVQY